MAYWSSEPRLGLCSLITLSILMWLSILPMRTPHCASCVAAAPAAGGAANAGERAQSTTKSSSCCSDCAQEDCCTCTRELVRVLQGGATTLIALIVSLGKWYLTDFHFPKRKPVNCLPEVSLLRVFWTNIAGVLLPQVFMSFVLSSALCATILQQRVAKEKRRMAKMLSSMVVWIQVDQPGLDMDAFSREHASLREFFTEYELPVSDADHACGAAEGVEQSEKEGEQSQLAWAVNGRDPHDELSKLPKAPGVQDALVLYFSTSGDMRQMITAEAERQNISGISTEASSETKTRSEQSKAETTASRRAYILCAQDWDAKNRLLKEAMLQTKGVLPSMEELQPIQARTTMECVGVAIQALGYFLGILSRFAAAAHGGRGSRVILAPVEIISAWISIVLVVQVVAIPQLVTFCSKGMFLHLPPEKFQEVIRFYECGKERRNEIDITFKTVCLFVLCLFFLFGLFLILIPVLVYYYYRLPDHWLSFASLILFTMLSGISIMVFVLTLIFPALQVLSAFSAFPGLRQAMGPRASAAANASKKIGSINLLAIVSSAILLLGLSAYALAIADTVMNWHRFRARDCYFSSFVIPHVGS